jgi:GT2 family glycosyltransferase
MSAPAWGLAPRVAVCIPAHGDPVALSHVLASVRAAAHPAELLQVVVAVDGPDEALADLARAQGATIVVLPVNGGSYAARNAALDAVREGTDVVLFTDTDCEVAREWIAAHLRALRSADASGGAVRLTTSDPPSAAEWVDASRHLRQEHFVNVLGFAATCNLAVRTDVLARIRFDPTLRSGGDFDFGQRLAKAGYRLVYTADALVQHPARRSARGVLRKVSRVASGAAVNQSRGHPATGRRDPTRVPAARRAAAEGIDGGAYWRLQVRALDVACSLAYARHVPSVVLPAVRRRLRLRR